MRTQPDTAPDADHDGISDHVEQSLLSQFAPTFMVSRHECSLLPAEFVPGLREPTVKAENGTIYGQVTPVRAKSSSAPSAEIHFYHLWRQDCGAHGHPLDVEHVSVLVRASTADPTRWKALYWFAAAHENTVCDVSQIARASTLHAEDHGAVVWISAGKHASFLSEARCEHGCGEDVCRDAVPMPIASIINLGEADAPMNDSLWAASRRWPLAAKMSDIDFPAEAINRASDLPSTEIVPFNPGRHPMQGTIAISSVTADALSNSGRNTADAIALGEESTGNALSKSYRNTAHSLSRAAHRVAKALHMSPAG